MAHQCRARPVAPPLLARRRRVFLGGSERKTHLVAGTDRNLAVRHRFANLVLPGLGVLVRLELGSAGLNPGVGLMPPSEFHPGA